MGLSSKKSTTSTNQTYTGSTTSTPNVPDWLSNPYKAQAGTVSQLQTLDPSQFASQASGLQNQAFQTAGGLTTSPNYDTATTQINGINYTPQQIQGQSLLSGLQDYFNPYKDQVLNPVLNDLDVQAGQTRAAQAAKEAATGSFRGSRAGIAEGETEGNLARARATTEGGLLNDMYGQAVSASNSDAQRRQDAAAANAANGITANGQRLQGAGLLSTIGAQQGSDARANLDTQATLGATQQAIEDSQRQAPLNYASAMEGLLSGLDPSLFTGQTSNASGQQQGTSTTKESGSLGSFLGNLLTAASGGLGGALGKSAGKMMGIG